MKKGQIVEGVIEKVEFPNKGIITMEDGKRVIVKNTIPGQKVSACIQKARKGRCEGRLLSVLEKSPLELAEPACVHAGNCGGCTYQSLPYAAQLSLKAEQVKKLIDEVVTPESAGYEFIGIKASPRPDEYRNKMEFSFGDTCKDGPLALGMHKRGSFYDIVDVPECRIIDEDFRKVLKVTLSYFQGEGTPYYHKMRHTGYLRHLLVRKAAKTGEILIDLVTTTQPVCGEVQDDKAWNGEAGADMQPAREIPGESAPASGTEVPAVSERGACGSEQEMELLCGWQAALLEESYRGKIVGILHTKNDRVSDTVTDEGTDILYGQDFFHEELLGLRFKITPFSFFQTNSLGAEVLYETARDFIGGAPDEPLPAGEEAAAGGCSGRGFAPGSVVFDLYSGTGTIAQILSPAAKKVIGVEIVPEAVEAARENAKRNGLSNCTFLAGDVLKVLDEIKERPEYIVLDPPRDGVHPKALGKIIRYGVERMVYISCKPTSLARDLVMLQEGGYAVEKVCCVDMFPGTAGIETCVLLSRK